ncbi:MAG: hypothetical protein NT091_05310 [Candidatus Falkowbacteria bacterium]|nr:hypothetical protein [Candidatus Falkowbacteria bacterium]
MQDTNINTIWQIITTKWRDILNVTLLACILASIITVVQPLKYRSSMNLLVIQEGTVNLDYYTASKSTQYLSDILTQVIYSSSFFDNVMNSGFKINNNFSTDEQKRKKEWAKTVDAAAMKDTGIISVDAYSTDRNQVEQIVQAVSYILKTKNSEYHGSGDSVKVKIIDQPITTNWPVRPNLFSNLAIGAITGLFVGTWLCYLFPAETIDLKFLLNRKRKEELRETDVFSDYKKELNSLS